MLQNISQMIYDAEFEIKASTNSLSSVDYIQSDTKGGKIPTI